MRTEIKDVSVMMQDLFNDKNFKIYRPSENAKFELNISGMTAEDLAWNLNYLSVVVMQAVNGNAEVKSDFSYFPSTGVEWHSKWHYDDDYDECDFVLTNIILGCENDGDGWTIQLAPEFVEVAQTGVLLTDWMKKGKDAITEWAEGETG